MATVTDMERQRRILQLAQDWGVTLPAVIDPLLRPDHPPSYQTPEDDHTAEQLMQRRATESAQARPKNTLSRAFSSSSLKKGKHWDPKDILDALSNLVASGGSPGVAEALLGKLTAAGIDLYGQPRQRTSLLSRRKSVESLADRTALLRQAVEGNQLEMTQLLLPLADGMALDACLPVAIRVGNARIVEHLLRYGASVGETSQGHDMFRQACVHESMSPIIALILRAESRPPAMLVSEAMVDASRAGSLANVLLLSRSAADADFNSAEALRCAVGLGRRDLVLAIVMGVRPPQVDSLNDAFLMLADHPTLDVTSKLEISEILLCAGAQGDKPGHVLDQACQNDFHDMAYLLASYGVSIEYNGGSALKTAISTGQTDLAFALLNDQSVLSSSLASECVSLISKQAAFETRNELLVRLLQKGASGKPLDQCLIDAAEAGDLSAVDLLLQPFFSTSMVPGNDQTRIRHAVASPNYKSGEALRTAVLRADLMLAEKILAARPSPETLTSVFPLTRNLYQSDRSQMIELFLRGSLSGECLHVALQDALDAPRSQRDDDLIKLLLDHGADINYNAGEALVPIIKQMDLKFINGIIAKLSPQTAAAHVPHAARVPDHKARFEMLTMLLRMGAAIGTKQIANAMLDTVVEKPVDLAVLQLLLEKGNADINTSDGAVFKKALENSEPDVLKTLLAYGKPSDVTISRALQELAAMFSNDAKRVKMAALIAKSSRGDDLNRILLQEAQSIIQHRDKQPIMSTFDHLLEIGADPNSYKSAALCHAVIAANEPLLDRIFNCRYPPTIISLGFALPHAMRVSKSDDRLSLTRRLVNSGAEPAEVNRALTYAIGQYPQDVMLLQVLASRADMSDGEALPMAVGKEHPELVSVILSSFQHSKEVRHAAMGQAIEIKNRPIRVDICQMLLIAGISTEISSSALLVAARDGDLALGKVLMAHGASIAGNSGQAIIEGSRGGSVEVLSVLLQSGVDADKRTLGKAFQAATEVKDLSKRAVIFELLLKEGVSGEIVDAQLEPATRYGEPGEPILKVLLAAGADPNYQGGGSVLAATRSAYIGSLELLLGTWDESHTQRRVSAPILAKSLSASLPLNRSIRQRIVQSLISAGLPVGAELHKALNYAVKEEEPEERLVKMLLDHGASPIINECQTLVDAAKNTAHNCLPLLLTKDISRADTGRAFARSFTSDSYSKWFTDSGLQTAKLLLEKGAKNDALSSALVSVMKMATPENVRLSDRFVTMLISFGPDVDYNDGEPLQVAASKANVAWCNSLLTCSPASKTLSFAFQCIFDTARSEEEALDLFKLFAEHRESGVEIDVMATQKGKEPILVRAMRQYPRSTAVLSTLLDAGYYQDQSVKCKLMEGGSEEDVTLLMWAIAQPQKKISTSVIELLTERGANVNACSPLTRNTPLMLAIQCCRPDVVSILLLEGAEVDVVDSEGRTPLSVATSMRSDVAIQMMTRILAAEPCQDDGSLHNAASQLNFPAVQVLVGAGHHPDFPSTLHDGRSALSEVCLHGSDHAHEHQELERELQKIMSYLMEANSDLSIKYNGKSPLLLCFDAADPLVTTRAFLKSGMWKHVNKSFNYFTDETHTYSPTMYIKKRLRPSDTTEDIIAILRASRATDVYYATTGAQPEDAAGMPDDIAVLERARKARLERIHDESHEHKISLARRREAAEVERQIQEQKANMEAARRLRQQDEDVAGMRAKASVESELAKKALDRRMYEQQTLSDSAVKQARYRALTERDNTEMLQQKALEWESRKNKESLDTAASMSAVRMHERKEIDRVDQAAEQRINKRLESQRRLVESQEKLAGRIAGNIPGTTNPADPRRQIGFVTELN